MPTAAARPRPALRPSAWPGPISVAYQPFIVMRTGEIAGVEALARFTPTPTLRVVRAAERLGRTPAIDLAVLGHVVDDLRRTPSLLPVHVNVSAASLSSPDYLASVSRLLDEVPDAGSRLVLEITETAPLPERAVMDRFAHVVRSRGCRIAIDDVPTGHDRVRALTTLAPEIVKLDGPTLRRSLVDVTERIRLETFSALAHEHGSELIAEGIELPAHVEAALALGAELGQGFALGEPCAVPLEQVRPYQRRA